MPTPRQLTRAPLREALIDLQITHPLDISFAEDLQHRTIPEYDLKGEIRQFSVKLMGSGGTPEEDRTEELLGHRYESHDGNRVVQLRRNGLTFSILRMYTSWSDIRSAAESIWERYLEWAGPVTIRRVAVRYINVLDLPIGAELGDYFVTPPQVPPGLPQTLLNFFDRFVIPFEPSVLAIITRTLEPTLSSPPRTRVILDIDVNAERTFSGNSTDLFTFLDRLRDVKNSVFFSSITERTLEIYE